MGIERGRLWGLVGIRGAGIPAILAVDTQNIRVGILATLAVDIQNIRVGIPATLVGGILAIREVVIQGILAIPVATQVTLAAIRDILGATQVILATLEVAGRGPILLRRIYGSSITCRASTGAKGRRLAKLLMVACPLLSRTWPHTASSLVCHRVRARVGV